jgi:Ca2+/H+ antiporter, TMEM165/GDT1 family
LGQQAFGAMPALSAILQAMDWKLLASTFAAIFVAEIGDKTQLATLSLAAGGSSRWVVFAGAAFALITTSAIAVLAGETLVRVISPVVLRRGAGVVFIVLGVLFLFARGEDSGDASATTPIEAEAEAPPAAGRDAT